MAHDLLAGDGQDLANELEVRDGHFFQCDATHPAPYVARVGLMQTGDRLLSDADIAAAYGLLPRAGEQGGIDGIPARGSASWRFFKPADQPAEQILLKSQEPMLDHRIEGEMSYGERNG